MFPLLSGREQRGMQEEEAELFVVLPLLIFPPPCKPTEFEAVWFSEVAPANQSATGLCVRA